MTSATFQVEVTPEDALAFARLSGDWNPLHTDPAHAARTAYRTPVLHGAFSAGLLSRLAGMHLPGTDCLLHGMRLRFLAPILPPATLVVTARLVSESGGVGRVEASVTDAATGARYVDGGYDFSHHEVADRPAGAARFQSAPDGDAPRILVTGATGGLGRAVMDRLGERALGVSRRAEPALLCAPDLERLRDALGDRRVGGIVHCAWPAPDNERLTDLARIDSAVEHQLASPVRQIVSLAQLLAERGTDGALLVLVGSSFAAPGRHNYRMPLYSLGKCLVPELARVLALELAPANRRCAAVTFDVIDGGMNKRLTPGVRLQHADRTPTGVLPTPDVAAEQILWLLDNPSTLVSGATLALTGGAIP